MAIRPRDRYAWAGEDRSQTPDGAVCPDAVSQLSKVQRLKSRVLPVVAAIPEGRVTTYGAIARHLRTTARQVGFIMATLTAPESKRLPWFRVVAANGIVSTTKLGSVGRRQIARLRAEGIAVTPGNRVLDFQKIAWLPGRYAGHGMPALSLERHETPTLP